MKKEGQGSALDPLGPQAPDPAPYSWAEGPIIFVGKKRIGFAREPRKLQTNGVWGLRPQRGRGAAPLAFLNASAPCT